MLNADRQTDRQTQTDRQADRQTGRQADRQTGRRADGQTGRQADRQTDRRTGRQADRQTGATGMPWCVAVSEPPAETSLWSCFEGMGAALWSWFLVGSEGNVRQWSLLARCRFRPSVPWCFAVSEPPAGRSLWSCFEGMGAALWSWFLVGSEGNVR